MNWEAGHAAEHGDAPHTIGRWLSDRAARTPERTAIDDRGVTISYGELERRSHELAQSLGRAGFGIADRVATVSGNSIDHVVVFFACAKAGLVFVPLSWRLTPRELGEMLVRAAPQLLLVEDEYIGLALEASTAMAMDTPTAHLGTTGIEASVPARRIQAWPEQRPVQDDDALLVIFTSGSSAAPKGVVLTHANCFWNNLALARALDLTANDVVLATLPQFHVAAWNVQPLLAWWVGATVVLERSFQPTRVLQLIHERGVTVMMGVPTQYRMLADAPKFATADLSTLRIAVVGGGTMLPSLQETWAARSVPLTQGYGLTEASPNVLYLPAHLAAANPGSVGRPYPYVEVRIADPVTGATLEGVAEGELWVSGPGVFAGYLDDPGATAEAMVGEWLRTGDLVSRDADGMLRVVDRLKDIFISGGENVAPAEVEAALALHPFIEAVAVVGVADPVWGERGVAFVVARGGAALTEREVLEHARRVLAAYKVPVRVAVVSELPTSTIDKISRSRLREAAAELSQGARNEHV